MALCRRSTGMRSQHNTSSKSAQESATDRARHNWRGRFPGERAVTDYHSERNDAAESKLQQALAMTAGARRTGSHGSAAALLGELSAACGDLHQARDLYAEALAVRRVSGPLQDAAHLLFLIGGLYVRLGQFTEAEAYLDEAERIWRREEDATGIVMVMGTCAEAVLQAGQDERRNVQAHHPD